jgi:nitrite reductase/ring-hydroxylating ferredoxin subunit
MGIRSFIRRKVSDKLTGSVPGSNTALPRDERPLPVGQDEHGFTAVLRITDLPAGQGKTVAVDGTAIAVFHVNELFYAIDDACTHEDAPLGEGAIRGTTVVCPYHDWVYEITTGECRTDPSRPVGCFATKTHDGFVWVGGRTSDGTADRGGDHADGLTTSEHAS